VQVEGLITSFNGTALHVNDAIVVHATCVGGTPSTISLDGTWPLTGLGQLDSNACCSTQSFGGIATSTATATFTVTASESCPEWVIIGDEFTGNDPTGGKTTFDASTSSATMDVAGVNITTAHDHDAVWGAITTGGTARAGIGFTKSADVQGNITEYRLSTDPHGMVESVAFDGVGGYVEITAVTIKPQ
jgi:hypothetical protein